MRPSSDPRYGAHLATNYERVEKGAHMLGNTDVVANVAVRNLDTAKRFA